MKQAFSVPETGEIVLVKPNGTAEFWKGDRLANTITFESEMAALNYVKEKGWKEVPLAV